MKKTDTLSIAKGYRRAGFSVIPLLPKSKKPAIPWREFQKRLPTEEELEAWFDNGSQYNIGIVTGKVSGLAVLDADSVEAVEWCEANLPKTPAVKTARGRHYYFRFRDGLKNSVRVNGLNLDVRGQGGYVAAPCSIHESGAVYHWVEGRGLDDIPLAEFPTHLLIGRNEKTSSNKEAKTGNKYGQAALASELTKLCAATEGERNDNLNRAAFSLGTLVAGGGLDKHQVEASLLSAAISIGLTEAEARTTIKSGMDAGALEPRTAPKGNEHGATVSSITETRKEIHTDPVPLPDELSPVADFDFSLLPDAVRPWAEDISERIQCPPDFVAVGVITSLAGVLGRKVAIRPQERTNWTVVANMWGIVVGRPGVLKSPAIEATLAPLKRLIAKATEHYSMAYEDYKLNQAVTKVRAEVAEKTARKQLEKDSSADLSAVLAVDKVDEPMLKRYTANDTSPASLGELLRQNQNGLLVYRDELVSLLKGLDREDQAEGRGFYLSGWAGDSPYTFDRIGRGLNLHIEAVCLSVLGGTQPGRLAEYIGQAVRGGTGDDGLIQRFGLLVWPDTSGTWKDVDRWPDNEAKNAAFRVYERLDNLEPASIGAQQDVDLDGKLEGSPYLRLSAGALEMFQEWRINLEARLRSGDLHQALESHFAKYRKLIPGLALISHLADNGTGPVSEKAMLKALAWGDYLETHAFRAYGAISHPEVAAAKAVLTRIRKHDLPASFSSRDVWRPGWTMLSSRTQVSSALQLLVDYGWLREEHLETGGRPATVYHLNQGSKP